MTEPTSLLELSRVSKQFPIPGGRVVRAINDVSLSLPEGQTLALVGESGSGKTTLGRCIMGLSGTYQGDISLSGRELMQMRNGHAKDLLGRLQIVFQEPLEQLDPRMKIGDSIAEPLLALGVNRAERRKRMLDSLNLVGLQPEVANRLPSELSAGQQQRVGIARAMITEPRLVVLDEPTSALDPSARAEIIALLRRIQHERGTAYVFISHDLSTVRYLADRVAVLYLGMVIEEGPTAEVFARPAHPYTQALLGAVLLPSPDFPPLKRVQLAGEIPSPINLPKGCFLASRCPFVEERCKSVTPPPETIGDNHIVRCLRHAEIPGRESHSDSFQQFQEQTEAILSVGAPNLHTAKAALHG